MSDLSDPKTLARLVAEAVVDDGWDQPPLLVLVPREGTTPDGNGFPEGQTRTLNLGGRECPAGTITQGHRAWHRLVGHRAPDWAQTAVLVVEAWVADAKNRYDIRGGISHRPDKREIRMIFVIDRAGTIETVQQPRGADLDLPSEATGVMMTGVDRYLRAYMGLDSPNPPPEFRSVMAAVSLRAALTATHHASVREHLTIGSAVPVFHDMLLAEFRDGLGPDLNFKGLDPDAECSSWDALHWYAADGRVPHPMFTRDLAAWMGESDWATEVSHQVTTIEMICIDIAKTLGHDLARAAYNLAVTYVPGDRVDPDQGLYFRASEPGVAVGLSPTSSEWRTTIFGVPLTQPQVDEWDEHAQVGVGSEDSTHPLLTEPLVRAQALVDASGRDPFTTPRVPGDVAHILTRVRDTTIDEAMPLLSSPAMDEGIPADTDWAPGRRLTLTILAMRGSAATRAQALYDSSHAVPFFIDAPTAHQVIGAHLPNEDFTDYLRLPFERIMLIFDQDMTFTEEVMVGQVDPLAGAPDPEWVGYPGWFYGWFGGWGSVLGDLARHGGGLTGILLRADEDGRLSDWVDWVITTNQDPRENRPPRTSLLPGRLSHAHLRHVALNLAAYTCWGGWTPPRDMELPDPSGKVWRKFVRSSQFRKAEPRGVGMGVHVVHITSTPTSAGRDGGADGPTRTVAGHLRRGHWRRSRIAIRDPQTGNPVGPINGPDATLGGTYTYRENFIPPVAVHGGTSADRLQVYHLPVAAT